MEKQAENVLGADEKQFLIDHFFTYFQKQGIDDQVTITNFFDEEAIEDIARVLALTKKFIRSSESETKKNEFIQYSVHSIFYSHFAFAVDWIKKLYRLMESENERKAILVHVGSNTVNTLRDKVAWVLNRFPETRESDVTLTIRFWETFESNIYGGGVISPKDLYSMTRETSITRERARVQNQFKLFQSSAEVKQKRKGLSEDERIRSAEDKPQNPVFIVYMDESGKNAKNFIVGSIWFFMDYMAVYREVEKITPARMEYHFNKLQQSDLDLYKSCIDIFLQHSNAVSFKLIFVPTASIKKPIQQAKEDLYYHLIVKGVEQEINSGRAAFPRTLRLLVDSEEVGADRLTLANLEDRLKKASALLFKGGLEVKSLFAVESHHELMLQIADLFAGSINRLLNNPGEKHNHKDELAEYILSRLNIDITKLKEETVSDMVSFISL